jgi:hypothetical protein
MPERRGRPGAYKGDHHTGREQIVSFRSPAELQAEAQDVLNSIDPATMKNKDRLKIP